VFFMLAVVGALLALTTTLAGATSTRSAATAPSNVTVPSVTGSDQQGATLSASSGSWSGTTPITFTYLWERCDSGATNCASIAGATAQTYTLTFDDVGHTLDVAVTAHNSAGSASASSVPTGAVTGATPPQNSSPPKITGAASEGATDSASAGTWTGAAPIAYAYQWQRCASNGGSCVSIAGATKDTYVLTSADVGHTLRLLLTASNAGGTGQASSAATAFVVVGAPVNTVAPKLSGTAAQGQTLTTTNGTWSGGAPITYTYSWLRCDTSENNCSTISGAAAVAYALTSADVGHDVVALVTATNSVGFARVNSNAIGPVVAPSTTAATTTPTPPSGTTKLSNGEMSIAAASVPDTDRLAIKSVSFSPKRIIGHAPVSATFKIVDANGYDVSGALVYVLGLPYAWAKAGPEAATSANGTVKILITPTSKAPKTGSLVVFVRSRTPQGSALTGSSTRRLVQVLIRP
jgi:hypothetical protein